MTNTSKALSTALVVLAASALLSGCHVSVRPARLMYVSSPPPPVAVATHRPASPGPGYVWVDGHYDWATTQWVWVRGTWRQPPRQGHVWVPGRTEQQGDRHVYLPGSWQRPTQTPAVPARAGRATSPTPSHPGNVAYEPPLTAGRGQLDTNTARGQTSYAPAQTAGTSRPTDQGHHNPGYTAPPTAGSTGSGPLSGPEAPAGSVSATVTVGAGLFQDRTMHTAPDGTEAPTGLTLVPPPNTDQARPEDRVHIDPDVQRLGRL